jgi:hypothetical protein
MSQKTSTNSPAMSSSALTPASTYAPPASIPPAPISLSQTLNTFRCCGKTFRRPCDLRLAPLLIYKSPTDRRKTDGTQKSTPGPSNALSAAPATLTARPSTATPSSTTPTSPRRRSCTTAPSRRVRRNMSQPVATTVSGTLQRYTTRRGDTDEGAGGNQGRSRRWAVNSPYRSGWMRHGNMAGQEPRSWMVFCLFFGIAHVP